MSDELDIIGADLTVTIAAEARVFVHGSCLRWDLTDGDAIFVERHVVGTYVERVPFVMQLRPVT